MGGSGLGSGEGGGHVVYGAEGYGVELLGGRQGFDPVRPDVGCETEGSDYFAEESRLFVLGFGEGYLDFGAEQGYGEAGEAGSRAEVEEGGGAGIEVLGGEEAFAEVAADDLLWVADSGQVGAGVPLEKEVQVGGEPGHHVLRRRDREVGGEELGDLDFG